MDFFEEVIGASGPNERLWMGIVNHEILINGSDEIGLGVKNTAPDSVRGQVAEKTFHHV